MNLPYVGVGGSGGLPLTASLSGSWEEVSLIADLTNGNTVRSVLFPFHSLNGSDHILTYFNLS